MHCRGKNGKDGLDFAAAMDLILNMRGNNPATVKDWVSDFL
jgi:hypothetical protein